MKNLFYYILIFFFIFNLCSYKVFALEKESNPNKSELIIANKYAERFCNAKDNNYFEGLDDELTLKYSYFRYMGFQNEEFYSKLLDNNLEDLTDKELIAVKFANAMGKNPKKLSKDEKFWTEVKNAFSDAEITDLTYCIAGWMGMGRVAHVLGLDSNCEI